MRYEKGKEGIGKGIGKSLLWNDEVLRTLCGSLQQSFSFPSFLPHFFLPSLLFYADVSCLTIAYRYPHICFLWAWMDGSVKGKEKGASAFIQNQAFNIHQRSHISLYLYPYLIYLPAYYSHIPYIVIRMCNYHQSLLSVSCSHEQAEESGQTECISELHKTDSEWHRTCLSKMKRIPIFQKQLNMQYIIDQIIN